MSIHEERLSVGAMNRSVATRRPTGAKANERGMVHISDVKTPGSPRSRHLGVATEAQIGIAHGQHFGVDGAVGVVAGGATFTHSRVFKNDRLGLFPMALGATFVQAPDRQSARRLHYILAVRVVALDAIHFAFDDKMVLGQVKFRLGVQMALETGGGVLAGIDNEFRASAACRNMFAGRPMAGFTAGLAGPFRAGQMQTRVGTGRKGAGNALVAIRADFVAYKCGAFNLQWNHHRSVHRGTRIHQHTERPAAQGQCEGRGPPQAVPWLRPTRTSEQMTPANFVNNSRFQFFGFKGLADEQQGKIAECLSRGCP